MLKPDPTQYAIEHNSNNNNNNPNYNTYTTTSTYNNYYNNPYYDQLPYLRFVSIVRTWFLAALCLDLFLSSFLTFRGLHN